MIYGLRKERDLDLTSQASLVRGPWQASSRMVKVAASILKDGRHGEHGQCQELVRAPCPQCPGRAHHTHGSNVPSPCPTSSSQAGGQRGSVGPEHLLPPPPPNHDNRRHPCWQGTASAPVTFSSRHFRTFSSLCDAVWLHYPGLGPRPCPGV